ncbi:hypothetical protein H072_8580 [Dactylellina haptotyla CBS 200.50]|uniref:Uncharacterized protein n=1 Tax=Dactylellina haptotyla (strain CBS 200.50) TaxID=1284197 RepID=S8BR44_DACHA|nr:hypothetical protein H072_8580 [Dactylellina haptotyla CBS 200.50]
MSGEMASTFLPSLSSLPTDILYEISDYLPNSDVLALRLTTSVICQKLPLPRLAAIFTNTIRIFFDNDETDRLHHLERIILNNPAFGTRITHIIFDLSAVRKKWSDVQEIVNSLNRQFESARLASETWIREYVRENIEFATWGFDLEAVGRSAFMDLSARYAPHFNAPLRTADFFDQMISVLRLLHNLTSIHFYDRFGFEEHPTVLTRNWKRYNPHIRRFLADNPDVQWLPWTDWFQTTYPPITLDDAYKNIIACIAKSHRQISEITSDYSQRWTRSNVTLSTFEPRLLRWPRGDQSLVDHYKPDFEHTFQNLKKMEVQTAEMSLMPVSPLFLAAITNVEDLALRNRSTGGTKGVGESHTANHGPTFPPALKTPVGFRFPNLRRLEIPDCEVGMRDLTDFLEMYNGQLEELVCKGLKTLTSPMSRDSVLSMLDTIRKTGADSLKVFDFDFCTNVLTRDCYFSVRIVGNWSSNNEGTPSSSPRSDTCVFRYGTMCGGLLKSYPNDKKLWGEYDVHQVGKEWQKSP